MSKSQHRMACWPPLRPLIPGIALLALLGLALLVAGGVPGGGSVWAVQAPPGSDPSGAEVESTVTLTNTAILPSIYRDYPCLPLQGLVIDGAAGATLGVPQAFTVSTLPAVVSRPITYTWQVTGQDPVVVVGGLQDTQTFSWDLTGDKTVTVRAANRCSSAVESVVAAVTSRGLIAFERHYCRRDVEGDLVCDPHDIWVRSYDGRGVEINLTNTPDLDEGVPTWSPDGHFLAYSAGPMDGSRALYKMDLRSGTIEALTDGTYDERWPAWSPLGDRIAFQRRTPGEQDDVYLINPDGSGLFKLTDWLYGDRFPAWSRDGQWIAFSSDRFYAGQDLYIVRPDDPSSVQIVLQTNREGKDDLRDEVYPSWSLDGWIYYTFAYRDAPADGFDYLYRIRPDGSGATPVFDDGLERYIPTFSPDGRCFAFYGTLGGPDKEVWTWCNDTGATVNLTDNGDLVGDEYCAWSPVR